MGHSEISLKKEIHSNSVTYFEEKKGVAQEKGFSI